MTGPITSEEHDQLAAEYALGVLDGSELGEARALADSDPRFMDRVARWSGRLSPLLDEVQAMLPPGSLQSRIDRGIAALTPPAPNVVVLRRRVSVWRGVAAAASVLAASLALVLVTQPVPSVTAVQPAAEPAPLVAMLGDKARDMKLVASWNPGNRRLMVAAASDMPGDAGRAHELWMIPADGKPRSLGTMPGPKMRATVDIPMARQLREGVTLALSVEPMGGSPTGLPTGPVIASGKLERA